MTVIAIDSLLRSWFDLTRSPMFIVEGTELIEANAYARDHWPDFDDQWSVKELIPGIRLTGEPQQQVEDPLGNAWSLELLQVPQSKYFICHLQPKPDMGEWIQQQQMQQELHNACLHLMQYSSPEDFFFRVVESGLQRLGFDRMALFLIVDNGQNFRGTWGTDDDGEISNEMEFRAAMPDSPWVIDALHRGQPITVWDNFPLRYYGKEVGKGWNAMVPLTHDQGVIGWISVDNLLRRLPMTKAHRQLLVQFGQLVATQLKQHPELLMLP